MINIFNIFSCLLCPDWSQLSSLTECTSDNQLWINLDRNYIPQFPIRQIVAVFMENKAAIKINNLIVAHWMDIVCKHGGVKRRNCYHHNVVNVTRLLTCSFIYRRLSTRKTSQQIGSTSVQLTFQCGVLCSRSCIVLEVPRSWLSEVRPVKLLGSGKSGNSRRSNRPTTKKTNHGD